MTLVTKRTVNMNKLLKISAISVITGFFWTACGKTPVHIGPSTESIQKITSPDIQAKPDAKTPEAVPPPKPNGTVTSGGGHLYGTKANPWFLHGQPTPNWCLEIDEAAFGTSRQAAEEIVVRALVSWETVSHVRMKGRKCDENVDLRILLGTLTEEDSALMSTAKAATHEDDLESAAIAIRTEYNEKKLRGRGFIHVAPAKGPQGLEAKGSVTDPWTIFDGALLLVTIQHELGHVFGLQHTQESEGLMGARTLEYFLDAKTHEKIAKSPGAREAFLEKIAQMNPINLVAFPEQAEFSRCKRAVCDSFKIVSMNNKLIVEHWVANVQELNSMGRDAYTLRTSARLDTHQTGQKTISSVYANGRRMPGILASKATFGGVADNDKIMVVNWTAGETPTIVEFKGTSYDVLLQ